MSSSFDNDSSLSISVTCRSSVAIHMQLGRGRVHSSFAIPVEAVVKVHCHGSFDVFFQHFFFLYAVSIIVLNIPFSAVVTIKARLKASDSISVWNDLYTLS